MLLKLVNIVSLGHTVSQRYSADGLVIGGDAFGFLDLVFSSGVFLALKREVFLQMKFTIYYPLQEIFLLHHFVGIPTK